MKNKDIYWKRYKIQETLYIGQWCLSHLQSRHLGTSHSFPISPSAAPTYFLESYLWHEISSLSKVILVWGKARSHRVPYLGRRGLSHLGDLMFCQKTLRETWCMSKGVLSWWTCQSPGAHSCDLLNHVNSFHGGMFKLNTKFDVDSLLYSLSHFECDSHTVHMLTQWHPTPPTD